MSIKTILPLAAALFLLPAIAYGDPAPPPPKPECNGPQCPKPNPPPPKKDCHKIKKEVCVGDGPARKCHIVEHTPKDCK